MNKVRIDFAPQSLRRSVVRAPRGVWALGPAFMVLGFNLFTGSLNYRDTAREVARLQDQSQRRAGAAAVALAAATPVVAQVPEAQAAAVNAAVLQLNVPWRGLHDAVQAATPASVALLALEPDAKKSSVRLTAEAKSSDDMFAYVARLQQVEWFDAVLLVRHEINEQDPNRPIRFQIDARWKAAP